MIHLTLNLFPPLFNNLESDFQISHLKKICIKFYLCDQCLTSGLNTYRKYLKRFLVFLKGSSDGGSRD